MKHTPEPPKAPPPDVPTAAEIEWAKAFVRAVFAGEAGSGSGTPEKDQPRYVVNALGQRVRL